VDKYEGFDLTKALRHEEAEMGEAQTRQKDARKRVQAMKSWINQLIRNAG